MNFITVNKGNRFPVYRFEIVDGIPKGFFVWDIGTLNGYEDYLPLAEIQPDKEPKGYAVNMNTLKAIKMTADEVDILMAAGDYGGNSLKDIYRLMKRYKNNTKKKYICEKFEPAIPLLKRITNRTTREG